MMEFYLPLLMQLHRDYVKAEKLIWKELSTSRVNATSKWRAWHKVRRERKELQEEIHQIANEAFFDTPVLELLTKNDNAGKKHLPGLGDRPPGK